jgi:hypothetical protein
VPGLDPNVVRVVADVARVFSPQAGLAGHFEQVNRETAALLLVTYLRRMVNPWTTVLHSLSFGL